MNEQAIHGELEAGRAEKVRKTLVALSAHLNVNKFDIAELLYEAQENNYVHGWGHESLPKFSERVLGIKARTAQKFARIVKVYRAVGLQRKDVEKAHTSKLYEIATLDYKASYFNRTTKENEPLAEHIVRLMLDAEELTLVQIKDEVARLKGQVGPDRRVVRSFSTTQSAWDNVFVPAMEKIRRKLGSEGRDDAGDAKEYSDGVVFEMAMADINADPNYEEYAELPEEQTEDTPVYLPKEMI